MRYVIKNYLSRCENINWFSLNLFYYEITTCWNFNVNFLWTWSRTTVSWTLFAWFNKLILCASFISQTLHLTIFSIDQDELTCHCLKCLVKESVLTYFLIHIAHVKIEFSTHKKQIWDRFFWNLIRTKFIAWHKTISIFVSLFIKCRWRLTKKQELLSFEINQTRDWIDRHVDYSFFMLQKAVSTLIALIRR